MLKKRPFAHILVVDDERQIRRSLKVHPETKNYIVKTASSGEKATEILARWRPDLVILDLLLPSMDGIAIIRQIRKQFPFPIIVLSAIDDENRKKSRRLSAALMITSPNPLA